jgi:hypothetical protein
MTTIKAAVAGLAMSCALAGCGGGAGGDASALPPQSQPQQKQAERVIAQWPLESGLYAAPAASRAGKQAQAPQSAAVAGAQSRMAAATNILVNNGFESGATGWSASQGVLNTDANARTGASFAWLGGYNNAGDQLSQTLSVPAGAAAVSLQFWYRIVTAETLAGLYDGMLVSVHDSAGTTLSTLKLYTNQDKTEGWAPSPVFDLSAFAGRTIQLRFTAVTDESEVSSFLVDDIELSVTASAGITVDGNQADYTISRSGSTYTLSRGASIVGTYQAGERLNFKDATVALDTAGAPAQVYRLYKAAFNRKPDSAGLGYQIGALETTGLPLSQVSQNFINSPEFSSRYGALNESQFVTQLYQNVLGRGPDAAGLAFHVQRLTSGTGRRDVLIGFSESPENQTGTSADMAGGIVYTPLDRPTTPPTASNPTCTAPKVLQNGVCITPRVTCQASEVLRDGACVARSVSCVAPASLVNGSCVSPAPVCVAPRVLQNNLCVTPVTCTAPQVVQGGICVTPPAPVPTCSATQQLVNGVCVAKPAAVVPPLNGSVVLEDIYLGNRGMDVPWKDSFSFNGESSYIPILHNDLGETVTLKVCFARTSTVHPFGPIYLNNACTTIPDFKADTSVRVRNAEWWSHGQFRVYVTRSPAINPAGGETLVATYSALDWGFISVIVPPSQCVLNGSIRSTNPDCYKIAPPSTVGSVTPPVAPPKPSTGATAGVANAQNCVAMTQEPGKVILRNNCGTQIFVIYCGELKYSSSRCGRNANYFTHSVIMVPGTSSQIKEINVLPNGTIRYGACYGGMAWQNDGDYKAWADGSYACLKEPK